MLRILCLYQLVDCVGLNYIELDWIVLCCVVLDWIVLDCIVFSHGYVHHVNVHVMQAFVEEQQCNDFFRFAQKNGSCSSPLAAVRKAVARYVLEATTLRVSAERYLQLILYVM